MQFKFKNLIQAIIYIVSGFAAGFAAAWIIRQMEIVKMKKALQDSEGFLERERLGKERLNRETALLYERENELSKKLDSARSLNKQMDSDILLLQKSNEETEELLKMTQPELYSLKLKLIEANNTISRLKGVINRENEVVKS